MLIDAAGRKLSASSLAEKTSITDHSFEAVLRAPWPANGTAVDAFWEDLRASAVASGADDALLTRQDHAAELVVVSRSSLEGEGRFWPSVTAALEDRTGEPESVVFERRKLALLTWYLTSLAESETPYALSFDSIQHTSCVTVAKAPNGTPKDLRGACAFQLPYAEGMRRISWREATWSPIVSGFVVERTGS